MVSETEKYDEIRKLRERDIAMEKVIIDVDTCTTASNKAVWFFGDGSPVPDSDTFKKVESEYLDDIKCTGFGCSAMIPQEMKRNKVKLCNRCQNKIWRMSFK